MIFMILNDADNIMYGNQEVQRVYLNNNIVWERFPWLYETQYGYIAITKYLGRIKESITIPNIVNGTQVKYIGSGSLSYLDSVFYNESINEVTVPDGVITIRDYAFARNYGVHKVILPSTLTHIGINAFREAGISNYLLDTPTWNLTIPNSVVEIGEYAFYHCLELLNVTLSTSMTEIKNNTFYDCRNLKSITILSNITTIADYSVGYYTTKNEEGDTVEGIRTKNENFIIYGNIGSTAETYANKNGFNFIAIS